MKVEFVLGSEQHQPFDVAYFFVYQTVISPRTIQGMMGGCGLGVACGHIKAFGLFPFPHQRKSVVKACRADMP